MPDFMLILSDDGVVRWKPAGAGGAGGRQRQRFNWIDGPNCPLHGAWKVIPGGYSEKKQTNYDAFYVCKDDDCPNRPSRSWTDTHPAEEVGGDDEPPWPDDDPLG